MGRCLASRVTCFVCVFVRVIECPFPVFCVHFFTYNLFVVQPSSIIIVHLPIVVSPCFFFFKPCTRNNLCFISQKVPELYFFFSFTARR